MGNHSRTKGNQIFWDYFPAPSQEEIEQLILPAYDNDTQKARFENGLKTLGLSLDDFEFAVRYVKEDEKGVYQH
ncbi:MAG: hypothetical protein LBG59_04535 [Candidatus Peribacteria bacterium]|jgi:cell wall assembly regulator SMI1|nr:hypothetical protein [Candidatus Peribacteria bacterium]